MIYIKKYQYFYVKDLKISVDIFQPSLQVTNSSIMDDFDILDVSRNIKFLVTVNDIFNIFFI
jgi:hypothetical protein